MGGKRIALALCCIILFSGCEKRERAEWMKKDGREIESGHSEDAEACVTPFGRYENTVTYTLGKMTGSNRSNLPDGDTYENNAYTRYLKKKLNIQNEDIFEVADGLDFLETVSLSVINNQMPDVMIVNDMDLLQKLVSEDRIEDLTTVYEQCASQRVKDIYASYGQEILNNVTFDGKLMALPETNISDGPNLIWVRQDWMDELGLSAPKTLEDVEEIVRLFIQKDPGKNGQGKTVGIACEENVIGEGEYNFEYQLNTVFASCHSYPKKWVRNQQEDVEYGSISQGTRDALKIIRRWYREGIIDRDFLLRGNENIVDMIVEGQCGMFFGPWWAPNNPLMLAKKKNPSADWKPYLIQTGADGSTTYVEQNYSKKYVVVRKGYKHPEIVMKIVSVLFDEMRHGDEETREIASYFQKNVDPSARPLAINVDYQDALARCYVNLKDALRGKKDMTQLTALEGSYYEGCYRYQRTGSMASVEDWAAYTSRVTAPALMAEGNIKVERPVFYGKTNTMRKKWWKLEKIEKEAFLKIITGQEKLSYFDTFVEIWRREGGKEITEEVAASLARKLQ